MGKYSEFSKVALDLVGGRDNLSHVTHCATRVRVTFKSKKATKPELWDAKWVEDNMADLGCAGVVPKSNQAVKKVCCICNCFVKFGHLLFSFLYCNNRIYRCTM